MGDILCISRNKNTEDTDALPNALVLGMNKNAKINSTKQKQNPFSASDGTSKRLINGKKKKSRKKDKHIGPRSQEKRVKMSVGKKGSTDKTTNPTSSNKAALNETKKQLARENKSNKKLKGRWDNNANNEDSTQSFSTIRSLSRSNDIDEGEIGENKKGNGTVVETDRDPNVDSNDESIDGDDNERRTDEEDDTDEDDTDEDDTDDEDGTDEDDTDELDLEEDDANESSVDRDTQESDSTASIKRKQFKGILRKKLKTPDNVTTNKSPNKSPLKPDPSQRTNDRQEDIIKPALMYNIETGMTVKSIKELLLQHKKTSSDSITKQNDPIDPTDSSSKQKDPIDPIDPIDSSSKQKDPIDLTRRQSDPIDSTSKKTDLIDLTSKQTDTIDSTEKQTRSIEKNIVPAIAEETSETQLIDTPKEETRFNKKYPSV